jgi:hypothetical protein
MMRRIERLEQRVAFMTRRGGRTVQLDRGATVTYPTPGDGQMMIEAADSALRYYADGRWRTAAGAVRFQVKVFSDTTVVTTGDGKIIIGIDDSLNGLNLTDIDAYVTTVSSSGAPTIQLRNVTDSVDMLSTKVTIDANEFTSYTAATPAVIDTTKDDVATGDRIAIDVDVAGTGAKGLGVFLTFGTI